MIANDTNVSSSTGVEILPEQAVKSFPKLMIETKAANVFMKTAEDTMDVSQAIPAYRTSLEAAGKSPITVKLFTRAIEQFAEFLEREGLVKVDRKVIDRYIVETGTLTNGTPKQANTLNGTRIKLRSFFQWCLKTQQIPTDPTAHLRSQRVTPKLPVYLETAEETRLVATIEEAIVSVTKLRDRAIIRLFLDTGIRVAELQRLNIEDVTDKHIRIRQKGGAIVTKFVPDETRRILSETIAQRSSGAVFTGRDGSRLTVRFIQYLVKKWVDAAGISKKITPHKLRHTFATSLYNRTKDVSLVQRALGHASVLTTQVYVHVSDAAMESAMNLRASH